MPFSDSMDNFTPGTRRFASNGTVVAGLCSAARSAVAAWKPTEHDYVKDRGATAVAEIRSARIAHNETK
jgi:hypothetical protein